MPPFCRSVVLSFWSSSTSTGQTDNPLTVSAFHAERTKAWVPKLMPKQKRAAPPVLVKHAKERKEAKADKQEHTDRPCYPCMQVQARHKSRETAESTNEMAEGGTPKEKEQAHLMKGRIYGKKETEAETGREAASQKPKGHLVDA